MKTPTEPTSHGLQQLHLFSKPKVRAEIRVECVINDLMLQSEKVESQTDVPYLGQSIPLWEALKSVTETCFSLWMQLDDSNRDYFISQVLEIKERLAREGSDLVLTALLSPMQAKAVARVLQLGQNFLRTLDICMEALLRYPNEKSLSVKPSVVDVQIDWAVGGIAVWRRHYPYLFESAGREVRIKMESSDRALRHTHQAYTADKNVRSQISHKIIANIFFLEERDVAQLESVGLRSLRQAFGALDEFTSGLSEL